MVTQSVTNPSRNAAACCLPQNHRWSQIVTCEVQAGAAEAASDVEALIKEADLDNDGEMSWGEFLNLFDKMRSHKHRKCNTVQCSTVPCSTVLQDDFDFDCGVSTGAENALLVKL